MSGFDTQRWKERLGEAIRVTPSCLVDRVEVLDRVSSTQDHAHSIAFQHASSHGVMVVASIQDQGRGRLGARWHDGEAHTLPCSFAFRTEMHASGIAARAGLAALDAVTNTASEDARIKWPNDIVIGSRKVAGILIEQRSGITIVGIGINVEQTKTDFPPEIQDNAISLAMLGIHTPRIDLAESLVISISEWMHAPDQAVRERWSRSDAMLMTERGFVSSERADQISGVVTSLDPLGEIVVAQHDGTVVKLPVETTRNTDREAL